MREGGSGRSRLLKERNGHSEGRARQKRPAARFILVRNIGSVDVTPLIEHSKSCIEGSRCSAILHADRGLWLCVCVVSGVIAESFLFLPVTVNNSKQWQQRWSSCICSWSSSILKNKCFYCKCWSAGDREDFGGIGLYNRPRLNGWIYNLDEQMHFR